MRRRPDMRPRLQIIPTALLLVLACAGVASSTEKVELDRGLRAVESGAPLPVSNRPFRTNGRLAAQVFGRQFTPNPEVLAPPSEYGVMFEFDGTRHQLEAYGL